MSNFYQAARRAMTEFQVRPVAEYELDSWDEFVRESPMGTLYHTSKWQSVILAAYGEGDFPIIGAFGEEGLVGGFCALTRPRLGVLTAVTPLCTPYTGFLLGAPVTGRTSAGYTRDETILTALAAYLRRYKYQHVQCAPGHADFRALTDAGYILTPRHTLELNLRLPEEELWASFNGHVRRNIKKAMKAGFEITNQWDRDQAYAVYCKTFDRHGQVCPVPAAFFNEICEGTTLDENRRRYVAWQDGKLVAFLVALRDDRTIYYELAAALPDALTTGISSLLIWEMLREHRGQTWDTFDFVGANTRSISRFKEGFNPTLRTHYSAELCLSRRIRFGRAMRDLMRRRWQP